MRVIEHGEMQYELFKQCPNCSCKFAFYPREFKYEVAYRYEYGKKAWPDNGEALKYVNCPECRAKCYDNGDLVTFTKDTPKQEPEIEDLDGEIDDEL